MSANTCTAMPPYLIAISAILRLSSQLFNQLQFSIDCRCDSASLLEARSWMVLRETSQKILERRAMELSSNELQLLHEALAQCSSGPDVDFIRELSFQERG